MSEAIWSIIKYKLKAGCEDEFKEDGLVRLAEIMKKYSATWSMIELDTGEIVQINRNPNIEATLEGQIEGMEWLDSVDNLLEKDKEGSRTDAFSGLEMDLDHSFQAPLKTQ